MTDQYEEIQEFAVAFTSPSCSISGNGQYIAFGDGIFGAVYKWDSTLFRFSAYFNLILTNIRHIDFTSDASYIIFLVQG